MKLSKCSKSPIVVVALLLFGISVVEGSSSGYFQTVSEDTFPSPGGGGSSLLASSSGEALAMYVGAESKIRVYTFREAYADPTTTTATPTTTTTTLPPEPEPEIITVNGEEIEFEFINEDTGESLSIDEFFDELGVEEEDQELALDLNSLGIDIEGVELSEVDDAEEKVIEDLDSIDEQLAEDFLNVVDGDVTIEEVSSLVSEENFDDIPDDGKKILVEALNDADGGVKEEFEDSINIFEDEVYNEYVADGSSVDTETRRTVVAAAAAVSVAASAASGSSGGGGGSGGSGSSGGSDSSGDKRSARRRRTR